MSTPETVGNAAPPPASDYLKVLLLAAGIAIPIAFASWGFLQIVNKLQDAVWETWPKDLGYDSPPWWWIIGVLVVAGAIVGLAVTRLPGNGGHIPALGMHFGSAEPRELPGILIAGAASIALGAVVGPEAPLIALGGGLGVYGIRLIRRDAPPSAVKLAGLTGTAVGIATIFGSPVIGCVLVLEAIGVAGTAGSMVLLPALLGAGIGALIFTGVDSWTGLATSSLALPALPAMTEIRLSDIAWAIAFGLGAALLGQAIHVVGQRINTRVTLRPLIATPLAGLAVAAFAIIFGRTSGHDFQWVLFSGQTEIGPLISQAGDWSTKALILVIVLKVLAYCVSLGSFRGGPTFPALFIGAAAGLLLGDLPGLSQTPAVAMGIGAMSAVMLGLPLSSVVLTAVLLSGTGSETTTLVIVAVVVAHVVTTILKRKSETKPESQPKPQPQLQTQT